MTLGGIPRALAAAVILTIGIAIETLAATAASERTEPADAAAPRTTVRSGDHAAYGRLVVNTAGSTTYQIEQDGDHVVIRFASDVTLDTPPDSPRNVLAIKTDGATLDLVLKHHATISALRLDGRVVIDVLDPSDEAPPPPAKSRPTTNRPQQRLSRMTPSISPVVSDGSRTANAEPPSTGAIAAQIPVSREPLPPIGATAGGVANPGPPARNRPGPDKASPLQPERGRSSIEQGAVRQPMQGALPVGRTAAAQHTRLPADASLSDASPRPQSVVEKTTPSPASRPTSTPTPAPSKAMSGQRQAQSPTDPGAAAQPAGPRSVADQATPPLPVRDPAASDATRTAPSAPAPATAGQAPNPLPQTGAQSERASLAPAEANPAAKAHAALEQSAATQSASDRMPADGTPPANDAETSSPGSLPPGPGVPTTQSLPPGRDVMPEKDGPVGLMARRVKIPPDMNGSAFLVPFSPGTGAASFRRGDNAYVVFDERRPVDTAALRTDPTFAAVSVQLLPAGTLFSIPLASGRSLALTQLPQGWRVAALASTPKQQPIGSSYGDGHLNLAADQPGDVVSLGDPASGATLLVGTQRHGGQALTTVRRSSEFILWPTIQGVVVEALSDAVALKQTPHGFVLGGGPAGLLLSPPASATDELMHAALLTRRLEFSTIPTEALLRRAVGQIADAAASPPLARGVRNRLAAQSLLSLGLGAEAESLLRMAAEQDPKEAASADTAAMTAIAAVLAGRPQEAGALADPRLDGNDEIALWRAVRQAMQDEGSPTAAAVLAATAPLVFLYPQAIREHILPLIAETMIEGGELAPAARLLDQRQDDPKLAYARALMRETEGETEPALAMFDALAHGHDQFDRTRAAVRAVELRLATRKLDKPQAADALDKLLYSWRGDARELALRERVAELRGQTGAWRTALATLKQAETDFPEQSATIHERLKDTFAAVMRSPGEEQISPLDFVSMVDENASLTPELGDNEAVQKALADRLLALDLPGRARPVLEKLMQSAKSEPAKARFGLSLATLAARDGDDAGARRSLELSDGPDLPPDLVEQRTLLKANVVARLGDPAAAAGMLAPLRSVQATEERAQILENAADWLGAERAWSDRLALTVPETGPLDAGQSGTLLRLATAAARAGDDALLVELRGKYASRIGPGPAADMFRLLIAEPIRTPADIKRSKQEVSLAASLPSDLKALQPAATRR